jgi:hypothetical protein
MGVQTLTSQLKIFFEERPAPVIDFVDAFFPEVRIFASKEIPVDRLAPSNILAGYRAPGTGANIIKYNPGTGVSYPAPIISLATSVSEDLAAAVTVGMEANAPVNEQSLRKYANIQAQHVHAIFCQIAKQAADILLYGKHDLLDGMGNPAEDAIDFNRDPALFDDATSYASDPVGQIAAAYNKLKHKNLPKVGVFALVGDTVLARLTHNDKFHKLLTAQGLNAGRAWIGPDNRVVAQVYTGILADVPVPITLCGFSEVYKAKDGTVKPFIPEKAVVVGSFATPRVQAYGGIFLTDMASNTGMTFEGKIITDRFVFKNPDDLVIRTQSAPLLIPGSVDHTATVISSA